MGYRTIAKVMKPDSIEVEITMTFTLAQWKRIREAIDADKGSAFFPLHDVTSAIRSVVSQAEQTFYSKSIDA